jgi:hypothetical protein
MSCTQCNSQHILYVNRLRHFLFLSTLPILVALVITFMVHVLFFVFIPIILLFNITASGKKPILYICQSCKYRWAANGFS